MTTPDKYPIPHIMNFAVNLAGMKIFSKIDLVKGHHQVPINKNDIPKTAVITPFGLFEYLQMPLGLTNAAQSFQCLMHTVCQGLDFIFVYLDDILVASHTKADHWKHLCSIFFHNCKIWFGY